MNGPTLRLALLTVLLLVGIVVSLGVGPITVSPARVRQALLTPRAPDIEPVTVTIIRVIRLPRILLAALVGAGLGAAGAGYQGLFRNPLADPFVIGASSGAALGATLAIIVGLDWSLLGVGAIQIAALLGALSTVALVYGIAATGRTVPTVSLLLAGVAVSSMVASLVTLLMLLNDDELRAIFYWLTGSLQGSRWPVLRSTAPLMTVGLIALWSLARPLDALTFGEESAAALGLRMARLRGLVVVAASLTTAAAVAASGIIGFVGLIAPHVARMLVGARHALVIPASALVGALLLLLADNVARTAAAEELPVGVIAALLGSPFFLYLLKTRQRELIGGP